VLGVKIMKSRNFLSGVGFSLSSSQDQLVQLHFSLLDVSHETVAADQSQERREFFRPMMIQISYAVSDL
jgi:hypothetical protein